MPVMCHSVRAAAVARKVYLRPGRGVGGLSKAFGTKARRGTMTNTHKPASTGIIRHVLQQLESLKVRETHIYRGSCHLGEVFGGQVVFGSAFNGSSRVLAVPVGLGHTGPDP